MNYWKPQHEVFIRCMLKHEDPTKAYRTAYPNASPASARVGGHRLYNYPHIRQRIEPVMRERRGEAHKKALQEGAERERQQNERKLEMRRVLYKVMMRKLKKKRNFIINQQTVTIEEDPGHGTILNALVLDQRLEAGYDNWPVIESRFARIMASLVPREKRQQTVMISPTNAVLAHYSACYVQTTLLQTSSPIEPVISNGAQRSEAQRETISLRPQKIKVNEVISREYAIGYTAESQEISPDGRNDALIDKRAANVALRKRQQTVTNSGRNPIPSTTSSDRTQTTLLQKTGISAISKSDESVVQTIRQQTVTISPASRAQTHPVRNLKTARITRAVTKPAKYASLIDGSPSGDRGTP